MPSRISTRWFTADAPADFQTPDVLRYAVVESVAAIEFVDLAGSPIGELLKNWTSGLAFGPEGELRWLRRNGGLHVVYVSDSGGTLAGCEHDAELAVLSVEQAPEKLFLRGVREDGVYLEGRIPNPLPYPASFPPAARLAITLRHYRFEWDGVRRELFRCVAVVEEEA